MIKSAVKKGQFVKCEIESMKGRIYQIVDFNEFLYLVEVEKVAEGLECLTPCDFWRVSPKYFAANFSIVENEPTPDPAPATLDEAEEITAAPLCVGSLVRYKEIIDKGDEAARFVIAEDYGDGRVKVREITSVTAFGFSTYTRKMSDFVAVTDPAEIETLCEEIRKNETPFYMVVVEKLAKERKAAPATLDTPAEITAPALYEPAKSEENAKPEKPAKAAGVVAAAFFLLSLTIGTSHEAAEIVTNDPAAVFAQVAEAGETLTAFALEEIPTPDELPAADVPALL